MKRVRGDCLEESLLKTQLRRYSQRQRGSEDLKSVRAAALVKMRTPPPLPKLRMSKKITGSKEVCQGGKGEKGGKMLKKESDHKKGRMGVSKHCHQFGHTT